MTTYGIDVSKYQSGISWPAVKQAGVEFSIARASIGLATDPTFATMRSGAEGVGLIAGAYHFLEPGSGADQADVFASMTNGAHGLLAALDCEAQGLTIGIITDFVDRFASRSGGHPLFIYTGISWWKAHGNPAIKGPLWLAYYPGGGYPGDRDPTWDKVVGGVKPTIWQYGPRPIKGRSSVDGDAFRGTRAELEAFIGGTQSGPVAGGDVRFISAGSYGVDSGKRLAIPAKTPWRTFDGKATGVFGAAASVPVVGTVDAHSGEYAVLISTADPEIYADGVVRETLVLVSSSAAPTSAPPAPVADCAVQDAEIVTLKATVAEREDRLRRSSVITTI